MEIDTQKIIEEQFRSLPEPVKRAITSVETEKKFQELSEKYKLHLDQWSKLENQLMLTLLGLSEPEDLEKNIVQEIGLDETTATAIVNDASDVIFGPIREELERELEHPEAKEKEVSNVEQVRTQTLSASSAAPTTTQAPKPEMPRVMRAPISETYKPKIPSTERKAADGDPYREPAQ